MRRATFSLPPCGGGQGGGCKRQTIKRARRHPHPQPRPTRGRGVVALIAVALVSLLSPAHAQQRQTESAASSHAVDVEAITSPAGIEAWLVSDSTVPMIVLRAFWRGGSAIEPERLTGVTSVMTDMMTEGSGALDANAFKERLQDLNMSVGFGSSWDGVGMTLTTLSENRDAAVEMARLALNEPRFDAEPLARIKRQMLVGIRTRETNPSYIANLAMDQALYPNHPYARRTSRESVEAINRAALQERRAALFNRATLQITIVGDINAADAGRMVDAIFGALPQGVRPPEPPDVTLAAPTRLIVRALPQPQSLVLFVGPGIQDEDPDWIPLAVANYILGGGGFSSRLMDQVREQRGLVYGIGTGPSVREHSAVIRGSAQTENGDVREAIEVTRAEMARLYRDGATQAEVNDAITYLTGSFALDLDSNSKISSAVHAYQASGRDIDYINRRNDLIRAVTLEDVNRVIRRLFDPDDYTFVVVGQPEGLEQAAAN
jgi:zinc protease